MTTTTEESREMESLNESESKISVKSFEEYLTES